MKIFPPKNHHLSGEIILPSSKSISNRMLILRKLYEPEMVIDNLSDANDTVLLNDILENVITQPSEENFVDVNVQDAGTAFRFLTAFCAITPGKWRIVGTPRLHERPISQLVTALQTMGAHISYENNDGFAPLLIEGRSLKMEGILDMRNVDSSQFISAIIMIAPKIEGNWSIRFSHQMSSLSFMYLTLKILRRFGLTFYSKNGLLEIHKLKRFDAEYLKVEPDWTSFYYWFSFIHLCKSCDLYFPGISQENIQTEKEKLFTVNNPDVEFYFDTKGLRIVKKNQQGLIRFNQKIDFKSHPDLATCFAVLSMAGKVEKIKFTGLDSLKYKESDREQVIGYIAETLNCTFYQEGRNWWLEAIQMHFEHQQEFEVFDDHRIAMSLAPLALINPIVIKNPEVVKKSYPKFWEHLTAIGFELNDN